MDISILRASIYHSVNTSMHTHSYFQLIYCNKSGGRITVGDTVYQAKAHHVYFVKPNIPHRYEQCEQTNLLEIMFHANGRRAEDLKRLPDHFSPADPAFSQMLLTRIAEESSAGQIYFYDILHCALRLLLIDALRQFCTPNAVTGNVETEDGNDDAMVLDLKNYIDNHLHER